MPKTTSAKKAQKVSLKKRERNLKVKNEIKSLIKKFKKTKSQSDFKNLQKLLDKAGQKNIIHRNKAGRIKSRLSKLVTTETLKKKEIQKTKKQKK